MSKSPSAFPEENPRVKSLLSGPVVLVFAAGLSAADPIDYLAPQSPPKSTPAWVKIIDQGRADPGLKGYFTPAGIKVEIVAEFPTVMNPVGMTFAADGTLYVLEWRPDPAGASGFPEYPETITYKDGSARRIATMKKHVKDVVKVLRSSKGNGIYDQARVVLEDELPSSILLHDGWLYLSGRGTVRRYRQSKPDGPYDIKEVIARGFCGFHHHQVSGLTIGNDGWLYITAGDDDNYVEGSDGSRATVLRTGAVFRCRPNGAQMQVYSIGYRNPYRDVAFDVGFNMFHADNDNEDGSKFMGCRLMHVAEGSDFGWRLRTGARCCAPDPVRGAVFGELPGKLPPLLKTGRGAPAGLLIYNDTRFPETYRGLLYYPDVFRKLIRAYRVQPARSTFEIVEEFEFMKSDDPLFRPCQMVVGPDGAMYVCDWRTDSGGAGQLWGDSKHGRIYRLSWAGTGKGPDEIAALPVRGIDSWAKLGQLADVELVEALANPDFSDRQHAQAELVRRGPKNQRALLELLADGDRELVARIAALGVLQRGWNDDVQAAVVKLLTDKEADLRRLAADGLALNGKRGDTDLQAALLNVLGDSEPAVRRAVALAMGRLGADGDSLVNAYKFEESDDSYLRDGLLRAIESVGQPGIDALVSLAYSGVAKDRDKVVEALRALRTRPAAEAIAPFLRNPHLTNSQRIQLLESYANYLLDPPVALEPLVDYLTNPGVGVSVRLAGLQALSVAGGLKGDKAQRLVLELLNETDPDVRRKVLKVVEDDRVTRAAPRLARLLAEPNRPDAEQAAALRALRVLGDQAAVPAIRVILDPKSSTRAALEVRIEALRTLATLDPDAAQGLARALVDQPEPALRTEAVQVLGTRAPGARWLGQRFLDKKLPREMLPLVSEALRRHADKDPELAQLLTEVMKGGLLLSLDKAEVEKVRQLVSQRGDPQRGKAIYLNTQSLGCVTCHRLEGVGGNVGPDLTRIWETHMVEKIIEAIVDPSKEIKEGYQAYVATTRKGQVYTGLKVAKTADEVVLRDANAQEIRIATKDLEELTPSKKSLMPDNVVALLSFDQFIDLVAFLKDRAAQESLRPPARRPPPR
jgi:putative membrane-bound dehydrogenase-like protein